MRNQVMWDIRDAQGLNTAEKAIMWVIESRGELFSTVETLAGNAGMGRSTFYAHRDGLVDRGLVRCSRRYGERQKLYTVDAAAVAALVPRRTRPDSGRSRELAAHPT